MNPSLMLFLYKDGVEVVRKDITGEMPRSIVLEPMVGLAEVVYVSIQNSFFFIIQSSFKKMKLIFFFFLFLVD